MSHCIVILLTISRFYNQFLLYYTQMIDLLDRKILFELDRNSRLSFSEIARSLKIPHDTVRYRIRSLEDRKIVNKFHTSVDTSKLGFLMYEMFLKLITSSEQTTQKLLNFLIQKPFITWVTRTEGGYDIGIAFRNSNPTLLSAFIDELLENFGELIIKKTLQVNILMSRKRKADAMCRIVQVAN